MILDRNGLQVKELARLRRRRNERVRQKGQGETCNDANRPRWVGVRQKGQGETCNNAQQARLRHQRDFVAARAST